MKSRSIFGFDLPLLVASLILVGIGVAFIFSSGVTATGVVFSNEYIKQTIWALSGLVLFLLFAFFDYSHLRHWAYRLYLLFLFILILTLLFGKVVNGAKSWIGIWELGIQPSEFAKLTTILALARFLDRKRVEINRLGWFLLSFGIALVPMGLVLVQPDLGTAAVFIPIFIFMVFIAGADIKHLTFFIVTGLLIIFFTILPPYEIYLAGQDIPILNLLTDRTLALSLIGAIFLVALISVIGFYSVKKQYFYWISYSSLILFFSLSGSLVFRNILKEYQVMRLIVFLNPSVDPRGAGWNIIQSITAVGSGGLWGKGFLKGTQSHYRYIPQQNTDFIFSILSEEWGFVGVLVVFALFLIILTRGILIVKNSRDRFAALSAAGIVGMIFFHFAVNVGMAIGYMPITGIPLFFLSYGGSSLWTVLISVGILMNFYIRRYSY